MSQDKVRAELKFLFSADADSLEEFRPNGNFGISVLALVGPAGEGGQESFQFTLCTPEWFASESLTSSTSIVSGRHFLFVQEYNYNALEKFVRDYCSSCVGASWAEVAEKVARLGHWEFEDYVPYAP